MDVGGGLRRLGHERFGMLTVSFGDVVRGRRAWPWAWMGGERSVGSGDGAGRGARYAPMLARLCQEVHR